MQSMAAGETMLSAYRAYELKKLKADYAAMIKNKDNNQKALGNVKGKPQDDEDAFLLGFDS